MTSPTVQRQRASLDTLTNTEPQRLDLDDDGELRAHHAEAAALQSRLTMNWRRALPGGLLMAWAAFVVLHITLTFDPGGVDAFAVGTLSVVVVTVLIRFLLAVHGVLKRSPMFARYLAHTLYVDVDRIFVLGVYGIPSFLAYILLYILTNNEFYIPRINLGQHILILTPAFAFGMWFCTRPRKQKKIKNEG